jgi:hypothetical protein
MLTNQIKQDIQPKFTKKQIRDKLYYLKKTGQTNKHKRYLRQYRDYHSSDEDEEEPEETNEDPEDPEDPDFILTEREYNTLAHHIKASFPNHMEILQDFFNQINGDENLLKQIMDYFKDREKVKQQR